MSLTEFLTLMTQGLYFLIALLTVADYLRYRDRARLDIALSFGALAAIVLFQRVNQLTSLPSRWLSLLGTLMFVAHPYLLLRVVKHFRPVGVWTHRLALVGLIASSIFLLIFISTTSLPPLLTVVIIVYFVSLEGYAVVAFVHGALTTSGVTRWRFSLAAAGSGLLAALILFAGLNVIFPALRDLSALLSQLFAILSGLCYFLSFSPPRLLSQASQLFELHRFLRETRGQSTAEHVSNVLDNLRLAATRGTGGVAAAVALWDDTDRLRLQTPAEHPKLSYPSDLSTSEGVIGRAWRKRRPTFALTPADFGPVEAQLTAAVNARTLYVVPIATAERMWGLLLVFRQAYSLFTTDDINLLVLFSEHSAILLDYAALLKEQHRLIGQLSQRTAELEAANKELEAFAYSVSHDLRAPLRAMDGFSLALLEDYTGRLDAEGQDYLRRVRAATRTMAQLIDDLLDLSRVTRAEMRRDAVDLGPLAQSIAAELQTMQPERQVEVIIADGLNTRGDPRLLRVVLENLLSNAWKFTGQQPQARIAFGLAEQNGQTAYFVRDNGAGFDMAYADKLFGVFQRLHRADEFPGTGVGLATVQRIIHRHGGRVWAEGAVGQGATFYFTLP